MLGKQQPQARKVLLPVNLSKSFISINVNQSLISIINININVNRYPPVVPQLFRDIQGQKFPLRPGASKEAVQDTLQSTQPATCSDVHWENGSQNLPNLSEQ